MMEASPLYEITGGTYKGHIGQKLGETEKYVKIQLETKIVRCKREFVSLYQALVDDQLESQLCNDFKLAQALEETEREADRQRCQRESEMIAEQNREYGESVKADLLHAQNARQAPTIQDFEEVSLEEMRRVRLLRFQP